MDDEGGGRFCRFVRVPRPLLSSIGGRSEARTFSKLQNCEILFCEESLPGYRGTG